MITRRLARFGESYGLAPDVVSYSTLIGLTDMICMYVYMYIYTYV